MRRGIIVGGITLLLLLGCNNEIAELEKKSSFYESVMKIGHEFQGIFGIFGNAMGESLGIVKSGDKKEKVGEHFKTLGQGLKKTKDNLDGLVKEITSTPNADTKGVEVARRSATNKLLGAIEDIIKKTVK